MKVTGRSQHEADKGMGLFVAMQKRRTSLTSLFLVVLCSRGMVRLQ